MSNNTEEWTEDDKNQLMSPLNDHYYEQFAETMAKRGYAFESVEDLDKAASLASQLYVKAMSNPTKPVSGLDNLHDKIASAHGLNRPSQDQYTAALHQKIAASALDPVTMYKVSALQALQAQEMQ